MRFITVYGIKNAPPPCLKGRGVEWSGWENRKIVRRGRMREEERKRGEEVLRLKSKHREREMNGVRERSY